MRSMICIKIELVNIINSITGADKRILDLKMHVYLFIKWCLKSKDDQSILFVQQTDSNDISIKHQSLVPHSPNWA